MKKPNEIWSLIKPYRFNSIFFSYLKYIFVYIMIPFLLVNIFVFYNIYGSLRTKSKDVSYQISERSCDFLNNVFENVGSIYHQFASDSSAMSILLSDTKNVDVYILHQAVDKFYDCAYSAAMASNMLDSIYLYSDLNKYVYSIDSSNGIDTFSDKEWFNKYINSNRKNLVCSTEINGEKMFSIIMNIYPASKHSGVLVFNINKKFLDASISEIKTDDYISYEAYLLDGKGDAVYSLNSVSYSHQKNDTVFRHKINGFPVTYCGVFKLSTVALLIKQLAPIAVPYLFFTLIIVIFVAFMCSLKFYKSVAGIMATFEQATMTEPKQGSYNELHYISDNIVSTLMYSKKIEADLVNRLTELKKAQSIALQTQMNPHFLFNTLNLVNTIIVEDCGYDTEAVLIIDKLAELLTQSLDTKKYIITVKDEIEYAKKYLEIELIRNDYSFKVSWQTDENVLYLKTIKMILQPILENAVFHGIGNRTNEGGGVINVGAFLREDCLVYQITDNGNGMKKDVLESVKKSLASNDIVETKHIGIANVNSRIKILYGSEYGCDVLSSSSGTTVIIKLPVIM